MEITESLSKMGSLRELGFFIWIALAQIKNTQTQECNIITSISSPSATSLLVQWTSYTGATNYILDLRVVNTSNVAPVVVTVSALTTQKEVFGLKPGTLYTVVVKVFRFYNVECSDTRIARTVPDTSQIISGRAVSSTAIALEWDRVSSVDQYFVIVSSSVTSERFNLSFTNTSAIIQNLRPTTSYDCYVFTSNSAGLGARSRVRTVTTLVQPPAVVTVVPISTQAVRVTWQPVDKVLMYKVTVTDAKGTQILSTTVSSTFQEVQNLLPCKMYLIAVSSLNMFLDPGEPRQVNHTANNLNSVTSVSADYNCVSASAMVSWGAVFGAESYRATAVDQNGRTVSCTSTGTTCMLARLGCGRDYVVWVSAIANNCESISSNTAFFQTVPCSPAKLNLFRECSSNVIIFSWAPTNNTAFYRAQLEDSAGGSQACITTESSCFFTNTVCGRSYNFTVYSVNGECNSPVSPAVSVQTAPCKPSNLITESDCKTDILRSSWDAADGVTQYIVEGRGNRGNSSYESYYSCTSKTRSCSIPGVACGESLTMMITAFNDDCYSEVILGQETNTAPCVPQNLLPITDCSPDSITLTWNMANGALYYIASVTDSLGGMYTCSTADLNCRITGLNCGTKYNASIFSSNYKCNSSVSNKIIVETAPCPPSQVQTTLDCDGNRALVSWLSSRFPGSYTASMVDQSGGLLNCSTVNSSCWVPSLKCGQVYDVSITYHNGICRSRPSAPIRMNSVPCGPGNFNTWVDCSSGVLQLTWDQTYGANGYSASVVSASSGRQHFCNSTSSSCSLSSLACGESYVASVRSYNGTCFSMLSRAVTFKEVPCVPTNVTVARTCSNRTTVMWQASLGAQSYRVIAMGNKGHQTTCSSNTTTCSLTDLRCGQVYNVSVVAIDDACSSLQSQSATLQTGPCAPFNIRSVIECITNTVTLSWDSSPTSVSYTGRAVGSNGHTVWCNSTSAGCQLTGLRCGQDYVIRLTASDGVCASTESEIYTQSTAPCAPATVSKFLYCDINMLSVTWSPSPMALSYSALIRPVNGLLRGCSSSDTSCTISGLQCGLSYTLTVMAANRVCTGPESPSQIIQTAPCIPASVFASVVCVSNTVRASWAQAVGALSYTSVLTGPSGFTRSCSTSALSCDFSGLTCAQTYTLQVLASNSICNSTATTGVSVTTGPCDPYNVVAQLQCGSGAVNVSWQASAGARAYTVQAYMQSQTVPSASCVSSSTTCTLTQLQCGTVFNVSVLASDGTCNSSPWAGTTVKTAPCPPVLQVFPSSCISDQVMVSWAWVQDALDVTVIASSTLGQSVSCGSSNNSCTLQGLRCGQRYTVQGTSRGLWCNSIGGVPLSIVTVPCTPAAVRIDYTCGTSMAVLSWNESLGRENFIARIQTQDHSDSCSSNQTRCSISSLLCGRLYNVTVGAVAGQCNSSNVARTQLQTAPCAPQNVSVSLQCANNTASVIWTLSPGAIGYNVTALGRDGDVKYCRNSNTYCQIPNMPCSQTYNFVVTPFSDTCNGLQSSAFTFTSGPCPPSGVKVSLLCQNNVGSVSWNAALNAERYIATATSSDGFRHNCTTNGTSCVFLDLYCGKNYSITVVTLQGGCWSDPSTPVLLRSAICTPANLAGVTQCGTNDITITWNPSPWPGVTYFLFSQQDSGANSTFNTTATSITLNQLQCGWLFTVRVAAQDNTCTSQYSAPVQIRTAPCAPSGLAATASCGTNQGNLTWLSGAGALFYTTTLVSSDGGSFSCTSNTTSCVVKLDCDRIYTATVISSTGLCNSTANSSTQFSSAPCLISNVQTQLNCSANSLAVQWAAINGSKNYTALAIGTDGTRTSCNANSTACTIQGLRCGRSYGIAVTTYSIRCSIPGSDLQVQTAPCKAENLSVSLECNTSIATVRWNTTGVDQSYNVLAVNITGGVVRCGTRASYCTFNQFQCGETYTVTVTGVTQECTSQPSTSVELSTAPCIPTRVTANYNCDTSITSVTWDIARGADNYVVYAVGSQGYKSNCSTTDTGCDFLDLRCGQNYNITVVAERGGCRSQPSQPYTVSTGPCPHSSPRVLLDCSSNSALVSWTPGNSILYYNASADTLDEGDRVTCSTTGFSCNMTRLQCARSYQISVSGQGYTCPSPAQGWVTINSGPCPPNQVSVQLPCESNVMSVSWQISQGSVSYLAVAQSSGGLRFNCSSNGTTCDIPGLQCGQTYEVYVSGVVGTCIGPKSQSQIVKTGPCVPQNIQTILVCQSTVLNVTWQQSGEATRYRAMVETSVGQVMFPVTDKPFFTVPNILCGLTYNVTVVAQNDKCNSSRSSVQSAISAPCPPQAISTNINCTSNTISVNWTPSVPGVSYMVQAVSSNGYYTCNSTNTFCSIRVPCGRTYNISVIPSQNGCNGVSSPYKIIQAAPCVPILKSVEIDCLSNSAWVVWNTSAGAESYTAVATDSDRRYYQCNSSDSMCPVPGLQCGRNYSFSLTATNAQCSSGVSNTIQSETVPCAPEGVNVSVGCNTGTVSVRWLRSVGALTYTATLEPPEGIASCCTTLNGSTSCEVTSLPCGQSYMVTVTAAGRTCNSSQSTAIMVQTAPCQPPRINATVSCTDNVVSVRWTSSAGGQLYTVNAVSMNGTFTDSCNGFDGSCDLRGLVCGLQYTATVVAQHSSCLSLPSPPTLIKTVPCVPQNIKLDLDCQARNLTVSWNKSLGAQFYTAMVTDSWGRSTNCQSLSDRCSISGLACGNIYHASVVASDANCSSQPSNIQSTDSVPCAPTNIRAQMDILTGTAVLSWYLSAGALRYKAMAVSSISGTNVSCDTLQTNCNLINLLCGDKYNVTIQAVGSICNSSTSMDRYLQTGPCVPVLVSASYTPSVALLLWDMTRGADSYTARAVSQQGFQTSCSARDTTCVLYNLNCSQIYNITLTAYSDIYQDGVRSNTLTLNTEPCPPTILATRAFSDRGEVTWEPSLGAVRYMVVLEGQRGDTLYCQTTNTSCSVPRLLCGTVYVTRAIAIGTSLNSSSSVGALLTTVPCLPDPISFAVAVQCANDSASISWARSAGATSYELTATSNNGDQLKCVTLQNSCNITYLECGQTYSLSLTAFNSAGAVSLETGITFQSRPCVPRYVAANLQCSTRTTVLTWEQRPGVVYYLGSATFMPGVAASVCNSSADSCSFSGLQCGVQFSLRVRAYTRQCWSDFSAPVNITTEPCQVQNLTVSGSCTTNTLQLNWSNATGAFLYTISVTGNLGYTGSFQSPVSNVQVEVPCGQSYNFSVLGQNDQCRSITSTTARFSTAPCVPIGVQTFIQCEDSIASVSWAGSDGAVNYTAVAQGQTLGRTHMCTTNATVCSWSDLLCGETYMVRVIASNLQCSSTPSDNTTIRMAPCIPQILSATMDCGLRVASLTWQSSRAAQLYVMTAENNIGQQVGLTTNSTSAQISELQCGQQYYFKVSSVGQGCRSRPSNASVLQTAPCVPMGVSVVMDCTKNEARVSWNVSQGAVYYRAIAISRYNDYASCNSSGVNTFCILKALTCGAVYGVQVVAIGNECSSLPSLAVDFLSVPCTPDIVFAYLNCNSSSFSPEWTSVTGAVSYTAVARALGGQNSSCSTNSTSCFLRQLACGQIHNITVTASNSQCSSNQSTALQVTSGPCPPARVNSSMNCQANSAQVQWDPNGGAESYEVSALGTRGNVTGCNTTGTFCNLSNLLCSNVYNISVVAISNNCRVRGNPVTQLRSVPCVPVPLNPTLDCVSGAVTMTWQPSSGATSYRALAQGSGGYSSSCNSNSTTCVFTGLLCGLNYSFTVSASDSTCTSANSSSVQLKTVPCAPTGVQASLLCSSNSAAVTWLSSSGALRYRAIAVNINGSHTVSCNSSLPSCTAGQLLCGTSYNVTVVALDDACSSGRSVATQVRSGPCAPQNVQVQMNCTASAMTVTWAANPDAEFFLVDAVSSNISLSCNTTGTVCSIRGLVCGLSLSVTVRAVRGGCQSIPSAAVQASSAPCIPQGQSGNLDCVTNSVWVSWQQAAGAESYQVLAVSGGGANSICSTSDLFCNVPNLLCGTQYTFQVTAMNSWCASKQYNSSFYIVTGPCSLMGISAVTECRSSSIRVSWLTQSSSSFLVVTAEGQDLSFLGCNSTSTSCVLNGARCGMQYAIIVSASSDKCSSLRSPPYYISTAPCAPQAVSVRPLCDTESVLVSWARSNLAQSYYLTANGADGDIQNCSSTTENCTLSRLRCGQPYTLSVIASDGNCTSLASQALTFNTTSCAPLNLNVSISCGNNSATLSWSSSKGSVWYYALAVNAQGDRRQCNATGTSCTIAGLQCGTLYNFSVQASGGLCNSSRSPIVQKAAAPCAPQAVSVRPLCDTESVLVSWARSNLAQSYYLTANGADGDIQNCSSTTENCTLSRLPCGQSYTLSVIASDGNCTSPASQALTFNTTPCAPLSLNVSCGNNSTTLSWSSSKGSVWYYALAVNAQGDRRQCNATGTSCTIAGLQCGTLYNFSVQASGGLCNSSRSPIVQKAAAPCAPQAVSVRPLCDTESVLVSWARSNLAQSYYLTATGADGDIQNCSSTTENCTLSRLPCGQSYTLSVIASDGNCTSPASQALTFNTTPCAPLSLNVSCGNNSTTLSWSSSKGSVWYYALAVNAQGDRRQCNATGTSCTIAGLQCGTLYNFSVQASDAVCNSSRSPIVQKAAAPCAPQAVSVRPLCDTESVLVSWARSNLAQSYYLTANGVDGDIQNCSSTTENCTLSRLRCGQPYTLSVIASDGNCTSPASQALTFNTTSCAPLNLNVSISCGNNSTTLSWSSSKGSVWYYALAVNAQGDRRQCNATGTSCTIAGLQCGTLYNFSVQASGGLCNSSRSPIVQKAAVPCPPTSVTIDTRNMENASLVRVRWSAVTCLAVQYLVELNGQFLYDPSSLVQLASYWIEQTYFEFLVPCDILYSVVVIAGSGAGNGAPSFAVNGSTGFCPVYSSNTAGSVLDRRRRDLREAEILAGVEDEDVLLVPEVTVVHVEGVTLHVEWAPVTGASYYTLIVREDTESHPYEVVLTVQGEVSDIPDLKPATRYCVTLSAKTSIKQSAYSTPVCITSEVPI
ncbi:uncharacterized protein LOC113530559 [Pangasianodon hypophthalmus]|uniref:uncharacterized protein LOC113530559 n=1 Tax=Pangasianodon hypophthalmus TaxID=310915 RepID=UPI002307BC16|nr:uncharacterized protein LOC113530559 [Pangasianodon hypophthalmus]